MRELLAAGDEVVCLARAESGSVPERARLVRADRRTPGAYDPVLGEWDEVIELAYRPDLVEPALAALADGAAHWTLVSTVSVYAQNTEPHADESAAVVEPSDLSEYADAKVAAERSAASRLGRRLMIARPGLIVGPGDPSDRFGYWPARLSRRGPALVPTLGDRFVQVIDVADLASWIAHAGRDGRTGIANAVGPALPMRHFFEELVEVTGFDGELVEVDDDVLLAAGVRYWAGPRSLPLWLPSSETGFAQRSGRAYLEAGGAVRPLRDTLTDVRDDERARGIDRQRRAGLSADEEESVLSSPAGPVAARRGSQR